MRADEDCNRMRALPVWTAVILVMIVVIAALGIRPAILVGLAIPGAFLSGILILYLMGFTLNIVVLFSLILVVGMLVDGAIVTVEQAERNIDEGLPRKEAYLIASKRMVWPVIASTATTLVVFIPLLFWPGMIGEFMKYMPITVLFTLIASLFMAVIFIPVLGSLVGNTVSKSSQDLERVNLLKKEDFNTYTKGITYRYLKLLEKLLKYPVKTLGVTIILMIITFFVFIKFGKGAEFFPDVEPELIQVQIQARGDLSIHEKDDLVNRVEKRLLDMKEFKSIYSRTFGNIDNNQDMPEDTVGVIQLEFIHWRSRESASEIISQVRKRLDNIAGVKVQIRKEENGPASGKPVEIQISSIDSDKLVKGVEDINHILLELGGFIDIEDDRPLPGPP